MFRAFARNAGGPSFLFQFHPADLIALCELAWENRAKSAGQQPGSPFNRSGLSSFATSWFGLNAMPILPSPPGSPVLAVINAIRRRPNAVFWPHLIYAYMVENTRVYEIFRRVIHELRHGEKLGVASDPTLHWLRATEELFYRDAPSFFVTSLHSPIRPDNEATRRSAYHRLLGMDLNHGTADNKPYPFVRADATNKEFVSTFEELLRESWIGMVNANNFTGTRPTDDAKLTELAESLEQMLLARRLNGNLSREEFAAVTTMSWFHLTLETDTSVVKDLRCEATSPAQRLFKIAQAVGLPAHGLSGSYFDIADPIQFLLLVVETGFFRQAGAAATLYMPGSPLEPVVRTILTHWSVIAGRDMKGGKLLPLEAARRTA
jgi:hypothetical protein